MSPSRKTERIYGQVVARIRRVAARGKPFTRLDLHNIAPKTAAEMLRILSRRSGELKRIALGKPGRDAVPAIYQRRFRHSSFVIRHSQT